MVRFEVRTLGELDDIVKQLLKTMPRSTELGIIVDRQLECSGVLVVTHHPDNTVDVQTLIE